MLILYLNIKCGVNQIWCYQNYLVIPTTHRFPDVSIRLGRSHSSQSHPDEQLPWRWVAQVISWHRLHLMFAHSPVAFLVWQCDLWLAFDLTCSHGRCCYSTITLSLWTRRYDVCALILPSTTLMMIRSSGYGRSSIAFNESGLALINSQRLRWRLPKIVFFLNRYVICPLILCVTCKTCAQRTNKLEW
jgi:hypothetical protein